MNRHAGFRPPQGANRIRDDEFAEMELRILVALYDAEPGRRDIRPSEVYRLAARLTGPDDAPGVMLKLLAGRIMGQVGAIGLTGGRLEAATLRRLNALDEHGTPWIERARAVIAEGCRPMTGHASAVRDGLWG